MREAERKDSELRVLNGYFEIPLLTHSRPLNTRLMSL
jgi:hypothetical protein